jgi:hypothetical protein
MAQGSGKRGKTAAWFVEPDQPVAVARRPSRSLLEDDRQKSGRIAIVSSLFLVLVGAALLVGGHAAIDPLLKSAVAAREAKAVGEVVFAMPDGIFCRHMSFDNATAEVTESTLERCANNIVREHSRAARGFAWGAH